jgi:hypothetical protein
MDEDLLGESQIPDVFTCFVVAVVVVVAACLLVLCSLKQFGILPLQQGNNRRVHAVWYPAIASGSLESCHCKWQFGILPLQQGSSRRVHAVWYPATASDCRTLVCSLRNCHCSGAKLSGR